MCLSHTMTFKVSKINHYSLQINRIKGKKSHGHLNWSRKSIWQNLVPLYDKNTQKTRNRTKILQHNKGHKWKAHRQHLTQWWKAESFSSKILPLLFSIVMEVLAREMRQEKVKISKLEISKICPFVNDILYAERCKNSTKNLQN